MRNPLAGHGVVAVAKRTFKECKADDLQGAAAEIAYHILFSTVPLLLFLTALTGFISRRIGTDNVMDDVTSWLERNLPEESAEAVIDPIEKVLTSQAGGILSFGAVAALWGGKSAMAALMKGLNVAFDAAETRPWWKQQLVAVGLTLALGLAIVVSSLVLVIGADGGELLADQVGLGETWATVWTIAQWPVIVLLVVVALAFLYWAAPDVHAEFEWLTPGSILTVVAWGAATAGLSFYFANFAGYTAYGALGAVMAFVFWLYVMSLILLLGGEMNAVVGALAGTVQPEVRTDHAKRKAAAGSDPAVVDRMQRTEATEPAQRARADIRVGRGDGTSPEAPPVTASRSTRPRQRWRRLAGVGVAVGLALIARLSRRRKAGDVVTVPAKTPPPDAAGDRRVEPAPPPTRADFTRWEERTVGELRAAVQAGVVAKSELQLYGLDWSQLATEPDGALLADVFARRGAVVVARG